MSTSVMLRRFLKKSSIFSFKQNIDSWCKLCSSALPEVQHGSQPSSDINTESVTKSNADPASSNMDSDTAKHFKKVMRRVPQPVVVVTTAEWDEMQQLYYKRGITCSSFTSVSLEPPVVSVCIGRLGKPCDMHDLLLRTQHFAVHVLSKDQVQHSVRFATPVTSKFEDHFVGFHHHRGQQNLPILGDTTAVITCKAMAVHPIGDHFVWYGQVLDAQTDDDHSQPLLYYSRSYRAVGDEMFMQAFEDSTFPFDQWTHEAHVRMAWNYLRELGREEATPLIKSGIQKYNQTNEHLVAHGYSETVTEFYIHVINRALERSDMKEASFDEFLNKNPHLIDRQLLFKYYSEDLIHNAQSRERYMHPDKKDLP